MMLTHVDAKLRLTYPTDVKLRAEPWKGVYTLTLKRSVMGLWVFTREEGDSIMRSVDRGTRGTPQLATSVAGYAGSEVIWVDSRNGDCLLDMYYEIDQHVVAASVRAKNADDLHILHRVATSLLAIDLSASIEKPPRTRKAPKVQRKAREAADERTLKHHRDSHVQFSYPSKMRVRAHPKGGHYLLTRGQELVAELRLIPADQVAGEYATASADCEIGELGGKEALGDTVFAGVRAKAIKSVVYSGDQKLMEGLDLYFAINATGVLVKLAAFKPHSLAAFEEVVASIQIGE